MASFEELIDGLPPVFRKGISLLKRLRSGDDSQELTVKTLTVDKLKFRTDAGVTVAQGEMAWNEEEETTDTGMNEAVLQGGLETLYHAQNNTGGELASGVPVMFEEAIGASGRGRVIQADLSDPSNVPLYLGPITETMADTDVGKITEFGRNRGINCSGSGANKLSFANETWLNGTSIYIDPDNVGFLTNVAPASPKAKVRAGFVLSNHAVTGTLFVISNHFDEQLAWGDRAAGNYVDIVAGIVRWHGDSSLVIDSVKGKGIKIDTATPDFGWHDMIGDIDTRGFGGSEPGFNVYQGGVRAFQFGIADVVFNNFHIPHDYAPGTDLYIHIHWSHNSAAVTTGATTWEFEIMYAKGHNQAPFTIKTISVVQDASIVQYQHMIAEVAFTAETADGTHFDRDDIETDGLLSVVTKSTVNTMDGGAVPFAHFVDVHYQSTGLPTKNKAPSFY